MKFHPKKCSVLRITRKTKPLENQYQLHGHILETETNSKYLGVTINNKLCWNNHINNMCQKANNSLSFLRRNLQISQTHIKANAYTTLIRPQLEYAAAVWDPFTKEKRNQIELPDLYTGTTKGKQVWPHFWRNWAGVPWNNDGRISDWRFSTRAFMVMSLWTWRQAWPPKPGTQDTVIPCPT